VLPAHTGSAAGQFVFVVHPQVLFVKLQFGLLLAHTELLVPEHWTQSPLTHAGNDDVGHGNAEPEPLSPSHPVHTWLVESHIGTVAGQSELLEQPQVFVAKRHAGVLPAHALPLLPEHCPQAPAARHAGARADGQARLASEPKSPLHPVQVPVAALHSGVFPEHGPPLVAEHWAHAPSA
jgi:hypothetical protein